MAQKLNGEQVLDKAVENARVIEDLLTSIVDLVPESKRRTAVDLGNELEYRMFYQDYLYDVHGSIAKRGKAKVLGYEEMTNGMKKLCELH